jgi:hypothetical protein
MIVKYLSDTNQNGVVVALVDFLANSSGSTQMQGFLMTTSRWKASNW